MAQFRRNEHRLSFLLGLSLLAALLLLPSAASGAGAEHGQKTLLAVGGISALSFMSIGLLLGVRRRKRAEALLRASLEMQALREREERLTNLVETLPEGVILLDREGRITFANSAVQRIFGAPASEMVGSRYDDARWQIRDLDGTATPPEQMPLARVLRNGQVVTGIEYVITARDGLARVVKLNAAPLQDASGAVAEVVASLEDVTARKQLEKQLTYLGLHDSLTGLYNRTFFEEEMLRLGSGRNPIAVIVCDIDGLKLVNDTLGHGHGDRLLRVAATVIRGSFRQDAVVARIGGDEFAILFPGNSRSHVEAACRRLHDAVERHNARAAIPFPLSMSIGFAVAAGPHPNMAELFKEADNAMYREKLHHRQSRRSSVVQTLAKAMEARDFGTEGHAERLQERVAELGRVVGLAEGKIADLRLLAHFHDIGKVGIPDRLLFKPSPLTPEEMLEMRTHCEVGQRIAQAAPDLQPIADWILMHHESWDGTGYPLGLAGESIPLECRIVSVVDAYGAMTADRPYREAMTHEQAAEELRRCAGTQYDPTLVAAFLRLVERLPLLVEADELVS